MSNRHMRHGATFADVVAILLLFAMLVPLGMAAAYRSAETANRVKCASNLRQIGQAILLYANENRGEYPRTVYAPETPEALVGYTGVTAPKPFEAGGPSPNDTTAPLFLLIRTQDITAEVFVCPNATAIERDTFGGGGNTAMNRCNFTGPGNLSYSFANPYPSKAAVSLGYRMNSTVGAEVAVAGDMNPGTLPGYDVRVPTLNSSQKEMRKGNSANHQGEGMNVLYGDGHCDWVLNPFCGVKRDNIYTVAGATDGTVVTSQTIVGSPAWQWDSVLLPTATVAPTSALGTARRSLPVIVAGLVLLVGLGVLIFFLMRKKEPRQFTGRA